MKARIVITSLLRPRRGVDFGCNFDAKILHPLLLKYCITQLYYAGYVYESADGTYIGPMAGSKLHACCTRRQQMETIISRQRSSPRKK